MGNLCEAPQVQVSNGPLLISEYLYKSLIISILQGDISEEDVDALVISNTPNLSNNFPQTRSILNRAGSKPQSECMDLLTSLKQFEYGMAIYTTAGELDANYIIHAIIPEWVGDFQDKIFEDCVKNCLKIAQKLRVSSISFPVLGTHNNSFPKQMSCELMFKGIKEFLNDNEGKLEIKNIRFISSENPTVRLLKMIADKSFFIGEGGNLFKRESNGNNVKNYESLSLTTLDKADKI